MRVNAMTEKFEDVTVLGHPMLFTCARVDRDTVPEGLYMYEVRHDDDQQGNPVQIANWIMVNHWGTLITNKPIRLEPSERINNAYRNIDPEEDWNYGIYGSDDMIVQVALSQIGNVGGEPYWSWYGFGSRVEWCACFVSWCADQCGYIETGVCPKYAGCVNGVAWFKEHNQWVDGSETPSPGMIIFYDWDSPNGESGPQDGLSDHTGIVERVENGIVYTVEGNSGDSCRQCQRAVGNYEILGYGVLIP